MSKSALNQNQFAPDRLLGDVGALPAANVVTARVISTSTELIEAGSAVKLVDGGSDAGAPLVDAVTGPTDGPVFGFILRSLRGGFGAGSYVEVALDGSEVIAKSSAAIARGVAVAAIAADTDADAMVQEAVATNFVAGVTLDKASGANQKIRVLVKTERVAISAPEAP